MPVARGLIDSVPAGQQVPVVTAMARLEGDKADGAVTMFGVVPAHEGLHSVTRVFDRRKPLGRPCRTALAGPEQGFREGIIVADARPAERGDDAEALHSDLHRSTLHGAAVVGVQGQRAGKTPFCPNCTLQKPGSELGALALMDLPADDLAVVDVHDQVEIEEQARAVR